MAAVIRAALVKQGIEIEEIPETVHGEPVKSYELDEPPQRVLFHAQGVVRSLEHPTEKRITKLCGECGDPFTTNYYSVGFCSTLCLEIKCKRDFGLAWKPHARLKKEKWEVVAQPEIVPIQALRAMKMIVAKVESDLGYPIEIDEQAFSSLPSGLLRQDSRSESEPSSASSSPQEVSSALPEEIPPIPAPEEPEPEDVDLDAWLYAD
jgi:hypothetical protein